MFANRLRNMLAATAFSNDYYYYMEKTYDFNCWDKMFTECL